MNPIIVASFDGKDYTNFNEYLDRCVKRTIKTDIIDYFNPVDENDTISNRITKIAKNIQVFRMKIKHYEQKRQEILSCEHINVHPEAPRKELLVYINENGKMTYFDEREKLSRAMIYQLLD